jgi:hypothetical protein
MRAVLDLQCPATGDTGAMTKSGLFIGWGQPIPGREQRAVQLFEEVMQFYGRLQQQGEIEGFEPILLEPHGGDLDGFVLIRGDAEKLARLRISSEFNSYIQRAQLLLMHVGIVGALYGEELQQSMAEFGRHVAALP